MPRFPMASLLQVSLLKRCMHFPLIPCHPEFLTTVWPFPLMHTFNLDLNELFIWEIIFTVKHCMKFQIYIQFEVLTAVTMKSTTFWDVTLCSTVQVNWCFRGTYCLHLQGQRVSQARRQHTHYVHLSSLPLFIQFTANKNASFQVHSVTLTWASWIAKGPIWLAQFPPSLYITSSFSIWSALLATCFFAGSLLGLLSDPDNGAVMFLQNGGRLLLLFYLQALIGDS
jgi:hypothetical protein